MSDFRKRLMDARRAYKSKDYDRAYEIYSELYGEIPFDNSARYSYAWAIYQSRVKNYTDSSQLLSDAELITRLTRQNDLNRTQLCVYTMAVFKVMKMLYENRDYENLTYWLSKINPDLLDEVRYSRDGEVFASNRETYYVYSSVAFFKLGEYEKCIAVSKRALNSLSKFTKNSAVYFQWRIAKSLRRTGEYSEALKYLEEVRKNLQEWYVYHEIAENYYYLQDDEESLRYALAAALMSPPRDMKFNLYSLLADLLKNDWPEYSEKHEKLVEMIRNDETSGKRELKQELAEIWKELNNELN